ncbi:MAG: hypothetical protein D3924_04120 [Candidatus Electrothrix sp. AR4]|nr:hypothetical protein [Candidatus Electrothrix sp. AR4]
MPQNYRHGETPAEDMSKTSINDPTTAFNLKGAAFTIPVLSLRNSDMGTVSAQLVQKVRQAPSFFITPRL